MFAPACANACSVNCCQGIDAQFKQFDPSERIGEIQGRIEISCTHNCTQVHTHLPATFRMPDQLTWYTEAVTNSSPTLISMVAVRSKAVGIASNSVFRKLLCFGLSLAASDVSSATCKADSQLQQSPMLECQHAFHDSIFSRTTL